MRTEAEIVAVLRAANPRAKDHAVAIYAATFLEYHKAKANIDENGPIVFHPRTGEPIPNPFLAVRDRAAKSILASNLKTGDLWTT